MSATITESEDGFVALIDETELLPVTGFFDEAGNECDVEDAALAVAGPDADGFFVHIALEPGSERLH